MRERVPERYNDQLCNIRYSMAFKPKLHELPKKWRKLWHLNLNNLYCFTLQIPTTTENQTH